MSSPTRFLHTSNRESGGGEVRACFIVIHGPGSVGLTPHTRTAYSSYNCGYTHYIRSPLLVLVYSLYD